MTGELAQVRIEPTGLVTATMSTHSQGHGTATTMAQCIADRLGVAYEDVTVYEGDSSRGGFSPGAAGSRQGVIAGGAAIRAAEMLADKVKAIAAHLLQVDRELVFIEEGVVHIDGSAGKIAHAALDSRNRLWRAASPSPRLRNRSGGPIPLPAAAHDTDQRRQRLRRRGERRNRLRENSPLDMRGGLRHANQPGCGRRSGRRWPRTGDRHGSVGGDVLRCARQSDRGDL